MCAEPGTHSSNGIPHFDLIQNQFAAEEQLRLLKQVDPICYSAAEMARKRRNFNH